MASREVVYDYGGSLSTIKALLKDDVLNNEIQDLVNRSTFMLERIKKEQTTYGKQFMFPVQTGVSQGVGARGERVQLPDPGFGEYEQAFGNVKYLYSTMFITGPSIAATKNNRGAFADALKQSLQDCRDGLKLDIARQVWGDGTGVLGRVQTTPAAATDVIAVTDPYGLTYQAGDLDADAKVRLFRRNMSIFIAGSNIYTRVIEVGNGTIRVASAILPAAGNLIYRGDASGRTSVNNEITGLTGMLQATGTYLGLSRVGRPEWQANLVQVGAGTGGALTLTGMRAALDKARINGSAAPDLVVTDHKTLRRYEGLLQSNVRFGSYKTLGAGANVLEFEGMQILADRDAPPQRMFFLRMADISWMMMEDVHWLKQGGEILRTVDDMDAYKAVLATYRELITRKPANQTVMYDITS